jgi:hypothetical protein
MMGVDMDGGEWARRKIVVSNLRLVVAIAGRFSATGRVAALGVAGSALAAVLYRKHPGWNG